MKEKKLGTKWMSFIYGLFALQIIFEISSICGVLSKFDAIKTYGFIYDNIEKYGRLIVFYTAINIILKISALCNSHKSIGYKLVIICLVSDIIRFFLNGFMTSLIVGLASAGVSLIFIIPSIIYFAKRGELYKGDQDKQDESDIDNGDINCTLNDQKFNEEDIMFENNNDTLGLSENNPILAGGIEAEEEYISKLQNKDGQKIDWIREGSNYVPSLSANIDIYTGKDNLGNDYGPIYINMYANTTTNVPVLGFSLSSKIISKYDPTTKIIKNSIVKIISKRIDSTNTKSDDPKSTQSSYTDVSLNSNINYASKKIESSILRYIFVLGIISFILLIVALNIKSAISDDDYIYLCSISFCIVTTILLIITPMIKRFNLLVSIFTVLSTLASLIPIFDQTLWNEEYEQLSHKEIGHCSLVVAYIILFILFIFSITSLIKEFINIYKSSVSYKMKCFKKIEKLNDLLQKDIISQTEFENVKEQIKIKSQIK